MGKRQITQSEEHSTKQLDCTSQKCQSHEWQRKKWETLPDWRKLERYDNLMQQFNATISLDPREKGMDVFTKTLLRQWARI